ncbi:NUDIX hydrolase [Acholeplasma equifetale]|uniref:NUDIX hydrolase n=1 Tax=Acholeplasma equifetale TaxID=264634 RepID=UPI00138B1799|nr:NUDIX domain-containing protein [Acholeplasma equifetale]
MNYIFTLAFIKKNDEVLMMNRYNQPWKGMWNGVGGKRLSTDESPQDCIIREIFEETEIEINKDQLVDKGIVTWNSEPNVYKQGMHLFLVELPNDFEYQTPKMTSEGILQWKKLDWINDKENLGVSYNIPYFIEHVVKDKRRFHYHCTFKGNNLLDVEVFEL